LSRRGPRTRRRIAAIACALVVAGCASVDEPPRTTRPALSAEEARASIARLIPDGVADRGGWARDLYAAIASLGIEASPPHFCAAIAVIEQESGFRVDPPVPGLASIAAKEIDAQRERAGIPRVVLDAGLALPSSNGRSYAERLASVRTERELSDVYEDFIGRVPFGKTLLADRNPVRTGGPMQVAIAFAEAHAAERPYPYPIGSGIRQEVFTRRGGLYFGIAHLLDYPASYDAAIYRFADFNAGHYASRNAAFQAAVSEATGIPLSLDGDLLRYESGRPAREPGATELAVRVLARRIGMSDGEVRDDLVLEKERRFERSRLYVRVFDAAERHAGRPLPRAVLPRIQLKSPKITRKLTTAWFAERVEQRYRRCLARGGAREPSRDGPRT
jgi:hypothetical protein